MSRKIARWLRIVLCVAMAVPFAHLPTGTTYNLLTITPAHADDDDDDGDDDGGSSGMRGGSGRSDNGGARATKRLRLPDFGFSLRSLSRDRPAGVRRANRPATAPLRVPDEVIALGLDEASIQGLWLTASLSPIAGR